MSGTQAPSADVDRAANLRQQQYRELDYLEGYEAVRMWSGITHQASDDCLEPWGDDWRAKLLERAFRWDLIGAYKSVLFDREKVATAAGGAA